MSELTPPPDSEPAQLAFAGGRPELPQGPPSWPPPDADVEAAVAAALKDGSWGRYVGPHGDQLRWRMQEMLGREFARLCCSGTVAVELALRGLGIGADDEVALGGYDFAGNFRCIEQVGAKPVLVDLDPATGCVGVEQLDRAWSPSLRAVIVSHLHGGLAPMQRITAWANERSVMVVEDACQAPGATVDGQPAGTWGDVSVFSFGGSKLLTAGRGGAVVTSDERCWQRMKVFAERGNDAYPLSELQAAVLLPQLDKLVTRNDKRRQSARLLADACDDIEGLTWVGSRSARPAASYFKVGLLLDRLRFQRASWIAAAQAEGLAIDAGFRGFVKRSVRRCRRADALETAETYAANMVVLHHPVLLEAHGVIRSVAAALAKVCHGLAGNAVKHIPT